MAIRESYSCIRLTKCNNLLAAFNSSEHNAESGDIEFHFSRGALNTGQVQVVNPQETISLAVEKCCCVYGGNSMNISKKALGFIN